MKFHTKGLGKGVLVVHLDGKFNMVHAPQFRDLINSHVDAGNNRISIDLTNVDFIDSSGLGALINALKVVRHGFGLHVFIKPVRWQSMPLKPAKSRLKGRR